MKKVINKIIDFLVFLFSTKAYLNEHPEIGVSRWIKTKKSEDKTEQRFYGSWSV